MNTDERKFTIIEYWGGPACGETDVVELPLPNVIWKPVPVEPLALFAGAFPPTTAVAERFRIGYRPASPRYFQWITLAEVHHLSHGVTIHEAVRYLLRNHNWCRYAYDARL